MIDKCRLCQLNKELQESHITPKLFFRQIKTTSPTKRLRNNMNPNKAEQDGEKKAFMCSDCEEKFSKYEKFFSILYYQITKSHGLASINTGSDNANNADNVKFFVLSVTWRNLKVLRERGITELTEREYEKIDESIELWRDALYREDMTKIATVKQYIIPTAKLSYFKPFPRFPQIPQNSQFSQFPQIPRRVFDNVCPDFHVYGEPDSFTKAFVFVQVPYLIFVSMLWGELEGMEAFEVGNIITPTDIDLPESLKWQLDKIHKEDFKKSDAALSDKQRADIEKRVRKSLGYPPN